MAPLTEMFDAAMRIECGCAQSSRIIAGVSGGMDSAVLLHLLHHWRPQSLVVAHVNHGLRHDQSDEDERFTARLAASLGCRFFSFSGDVRSLKRQRGLGEEEAARTLRLQWLEALCRELHFDAVALGHHAQDQAETVLMHLMRGSGLRGLVGIRPRRGVFVRPLLDVPRERIADYASIHGLCFRLDESNESRRYLRNRVRLDVLPVLENAAGRELTASFVRSARWLREIQEGLEAEVERLLPERDLPDRGGEIRLDIQQFNHYFRPVQKALLIKAFEHLNQSPGQSTESQISALYHFATEGKPGQLFSMGPVAAVRTAQWLILGRMAAALRPCKVKPGDSLAVGATGAVFASEWVARDTVVLSPALPHIAYLSLEDKSSRLVLRSAQPGDRFVPLGVQGMKKVSHFFIDQKIPRWQRPGIPVLEINGEIAWIAGQRLDDRFKITNQSKCILRVQIAQPE